MTGAPTLDLRESLWRAATRWGTCAIAVLMAHGAIAAGLLALAPPIDHGAPPSVPIMIDLADAAIPEASIEDVSKIIPETEPPPPVPASMRNPLLDVAPTPEPPPEVKIEVTIEIPPPEPPPPEVKIEIAIDIPPPEPPPPVDIKPPEKVVKPLPKPPERVVKRAEPSRAPPSPAPPSDTAAGAPTNAPIAAARQPNPSVVASWKGSLLAHLARHKRYPRASQSRGDEGTVYLRFSMSRQGGVLAARIERPSGHELLDIEASDLVRRAQPLPVPPAEVPGDSFEFVVPIQFRLR